MSERRSDFELLREFVRRGDQDAFGDCVRRHLDLVFATALRKVEDEGAAKEISQNVFAALARKAWRFAPDDSLPAWLYKTTLLEAKEWLRGELRRRRREQTAAELGTTMKTPDEQTAVRALLPLLDEALLSLREKDRTALLLRFYESQSLRDVGTALGVSEDTAQKRVAGALENISRFFQRRGFKTVTVAVAAAAFQHTASSAPAATTVLVIGAALRAAPPALTGLGAWLARLASLTKVQAATVCLVAAALPMTWQWNEQRQAGQDLSRARAQLASAQSQYTVLQTEVDELRVRSSSLDASRAAAATTAEQNAEAAKAFAAWKDKLRARLFAGDYRWPEDSPFIRIPKSALPRIGIRLPVTPPGVVKPEARELLGLTPQEREQIEGTLAKHFSAIDGMVENDVYQTNQATHVYVPQSAVASEVWVMPALGDAAKMSGDQLQSALKAELGNERWPLVKAELDSIGTDTLRRVLSLDAGTQAQEVAVWITERDGTLMASYGWSNGNSSFSNGGEQLNMFLPGAQMVPGITPEQFLDTRNLPAPLTQRIMDWIRQQAQSRLGKEANR
jgi:RNA polymerase sigma factor (sigma-70 family)